MNYKQDFINNFTCEIIANVTNEETINKLSNALIIALNKYDLIPIDEDKMLPAVVQDFNEQMLKMYLVNKKIQGRADSTLELYKFHITTFMNHIDKRFVDVTSDDVKVYLATMKTQRGLKNTSLENIRISLSTFYDWLHTEEYISKNIMKKVSPIKKDTFKDVPFSQTDIETILLSCETSRERALVNFLLSTGCRVSELLYVNRNQVNFRTKELKIIGKGNKERVVFLSDKACLYLKLYLDERTDDNEALFVNTRKPYGRISKDSVENICKSLSSRSGVPNIHPHRFRRTLCCNLISKGMPIQDVRVVLGHNSISTTEIYYNDNLEEVKHGFQKYMK